MWRAVGDDEANARGFSGMLEEHLLYKDAAEGVGEEDDLGMLPYVLLFEAVEEELGELSAGAGAVGVGGGVLGDDDVGVGEVGVGADEVGPVSAIGGAERVAVAVENRGKTMTRGRSGNWACEPGRERKAIRKKSRKEIGLSFITLMPGAACLDAGIGLRVSGGGR